MAVSQEPPAKKSKRRLTVWTGSHGYRPEFVEALRQAYCRGGPLEREFYLSPEILNADIDRVWRGHWLYAGHD